jgi:thermitase
MKSFALILSALFMVATKAGGDFDNTKLFLKLKKDQNVPTSKLINKMEHMIGDIYVAHTKDAVALTAELTNHSSIEYVEKNWKAGKRQLPKKDLLNSFDIAYEQFNQTVNTFYADLFNDPYVGNVWAFNDVNNNGISVNKAYSAPLNRNKSAIIVAVADTGVDYNHEDLKDVMWENKNEIAGNGIDDDKNGYIDDVYGYDFISNDSNPMGSHWHGTHVAGTIAAKQNNGVGIAGIASNVKIMALRVVPDNGDETDYNVVKSFIYAAKNGARIINCSFGKAKNEGGMIVSETIAKIGKTYGTLVIAAAGNSTQNIDTKLTYPASFKNNNLLVVAATTNRGSLSYFSNYGKVNVDLAAPGSRIYSTMKNNKYGYSDGTSMACPTTVGVAAEVLSHFPNLNGVQLKSILMGSVEKVSSYTKKMASGGRVNLFKALKLANEKLGGSSRFYTRR